MCVCVNGDNMNGYLSGKEIIESVKPTCNHCGSGAVYVKKDGTVVCRRCGRSSEETEVKITCGVA